MSKKRHISRRKFIKHSGCAAMGGATLFSTLLNLKAANAAALSDSSVLGAGDYKALVCIFLDGGNDSYNMLIPTSTSEYDDYVSIRKEIALAKNTLHNLAPLNTGSRTFGLHPSMPNLKTLFDQGKAAFVANVGTLIEPMTVDEFWLESKRAPLGLLSHSDQTQQWQTALPHERAGVGWGGRIADMINQMNDNPSLSMNLSMGGTNIFQTGQEVGAYTMRGNTPFFDSDGMTKLSPLSGIYGYDSDWNLMQIRQEAMNNILDRTYADIYEDTYANITRVGRDGWLAYAGALNSIDLNTSFNSLSGNYEEGVHSLGWVAKIIAAREQLGFKRQTFFVRFDGWDHHDEVLNAQTLQLGEVDHAINQFQLAMQELGMEDSVVSFVISDFARTLGSNGNGTDHAWGGNVITVGGPVRGQRIYGQYPDTLKPSDNIYDLGGGIVMPTTSADLYFAELAHWFGVSKSNLETIFPNLINFYDYRTDPNNPLNFLDIA